MSNVLPQGWEEKRLCDVCNNVSETHKFKKKDKVVFVNTSDVLEGKFLHKNFKIIKDLPGQAKKLIKKNDILFSEIRPKNKRYVFVENDLSEYIVSTKFMVIRNFKNIIPSYLYLFLTSENVLELCQTIAESRSGTFPQITFDSIKYEKIFIPSDINEQKRIADILSAFDDKIELNNQMNQTLEDMATTLFKEWFENFNFPNEQGKPYKDNDGEMKSSVLGEIPIDWNFEEIKKIIDVRDGTHDSPKPQEEGYPLVTSKHIKNNILDLDTPNLISKEDYDKVNKRSKVDTNDILLGMIGTVGDIYLVTNKEIRFAIKNVGLFKTSEEVELYEYIYFWLKTPFIKEHIISRLAGTTQKYISLTELRKLPFLLPPKNIIKSFKNIVNPILKQIQQNQQQNQTLKQQRDTLLPKLMSGEIRV